jgi:hypothetical protein
MDDARSEKGKGQHIAYLLGEERCAVRLWRQNPHGTSRERRGVVPEASSLHHLTRRGHSRSPFSGELLQDFGRDQQPFPNANTPQFAALNKLVDGLDRDA